MAMHSSASFGISCLVLSPFCSNFQCMPPLPFVQMAPFSHHLPLQRIKPIATVWRFSSISLLLYGLSDHLKNLSSCLWVADHPAGIAGCFVLVDLSQALSAPFQRLQSNLSGCLLISVVQTRIQKSPVLPQETCNCCSLCPVSFAIVKMQQ